MEVRIADRNNRGFQTKRRHGLLFCPRDQHKEGSQYCVVAEHALVAEIVIPLSTRRLLRRCWRRRALHVLPIFFRIVVARSKPAQPSPWLRL